VEVAVERRDGVVIGCSVAAPQPLTRPVSPAASTVAACASLGADAVGAVHAASVGTAFVCASVSLEALDRARPDLGAFQAAAEASPDGGFALFLYARESATRLSVRMFAPVFGVAEDPATGSAAAALGALLLDLSGDEEAAFEMHQGAQMGRPSLMQVRARRAGDGVRAFVGGGCISVLRGEAQV
jgi:trans-2,3-dihydro-3-hydroxyanthranilate isomerase